jgi:hypothetical protein
VEESAASLASLSLVSVMALLFHLLCDTRIQSSETDDQSKVLEEFLFSPRLVSLDVTSSSSFSSIIGSQFDPSSVIPLIITNSEEESPCRELIHEA